ncbi:uncharacterized protein L969DRAFT_95586 [Mixia osmundae IAM 14324]|uniref:Uncharacterized protein n=1 Tax=Mixia osmundae (strain CBS 9802 / IAM 14324 / JCM 22182 / KY 12970) TaxID=764103 RepID=G7E7U9_MIXOS|nr:uncharacterized protein L969DRAFT_95586 [Mixia osmundae IAM 14324]KEI38510.1 hypothetical protein L969DRAFT_95586 [Mixia osmundae IAM 14324]GAA98909.1 hypothetical protein E5Q_05597 [Mixia osmundae IAM 14324]
MAVGRQRNGHTGTASSSAKPPSRPEVIRLGVLPSTTIDQLVRQARQHAALSLTWSSDSPEEWVLGGSTGKSWTFEAGKQGDRSLYRLDSSTSELIRLDQLVLTPASEAAPSKRASTNDLTEEQSERLRAKTLASERDKLARQTVLLPQAPLLVNGKKRSTSLTRSLGSGKRKSRGTSSLPSSPLLRGRQSVIPKSPLSGAVRTPSKQEYTPSKSTSTIGLGIPQLDLTSPLTAQSIRAHDKERTDRRHSVKRALKTASSSSSRSHSPLPTPRRSNKLERTSSAESEEDEMAKTTARLQPTPPQALPALLTRATTPAAEPPTRPMTTSRTAGGARIARPFTAKRKKDTAQPDDQSSPEEPGDRSTRRKVEALASLSSDNTKASPQISVASEDQYTKYQAYFQRSYKRYTAIRARLEAEAQSIEQGKGLAMSQSDFDSAMLEFKELHAELEPLRSTLLTYRTENPL